MHCEEEIGWSESLGKSTIISLILMELDCRENVGACYRLAFQFGIKTLYCMNCVSPGRTNTYKSERHLNIVPVSCLQEVDFVGKKILLETGGGENSLPSSPQSILLGVANERRGASADQREWFDSVFSLKAPVRNSYNVSHALAVGLYELVYH